MLLCIGIILFLLFPLLAHWFFKQCSDNVSQYIFVLAMVFLGAYLAQLAGLEPIIGAFLSGAGLLNRLIPRTSPLMNRIEFVGNAIFIPFFLIGVGMLIDYRAFFRDWESIEVALIMIVLITAAKYIAAYLTQKTFRLSPDQRTVIFGLSSAHVAATLAAVMVGYNVILGHTPDGEPIRLLSESVLNGTILMILATCTVSTFATQRGAHNIAMRNAQDDDEQPQQEDHILIPVANEQTVSELVSLSTTLKKAKSRNGLYALNAIDNKIEDPTVEKRGRKILDTAAKAAAASDNYLQALLRYDVNIANAIVSVVKERSITDIVMGMHHDRTPGGSGIGRMAADVLGQSNVATYLYHPAQPLPTIKRHSGGRTGEGRKGGRVPDVVAETAQHRRQFGRPDRVLRPGKHHAVPAPHPRQTLGQGRIRGLQPVGRPHGAHLRDQTRRLPVGRDEPPRAGLLPPRHEQGPRLHGAILRRQQLRTGLPRTGRRHGELVYIYKYPDEYSLSCSFYRVCSARVPRIWFCARPALSVQHTGGVRTMLK